jgi:hypothetical protein
LGAVLIAGFLLFLAMNQRLKAYWSILLGGTPAGGGTPAAAGLPAVVSPQSGAAPPAAVPPTTTGTPAAPGSTTTPATTTPATTTPSSPATLAPSTYSPGFIGSPGFTIFGTPMAPPATFDERFSSDAFSGSY